MKITKWSAGVLLLAVVAGCGIPTDNTKSAINPTKVPPSATWDITEEPEDESTKQDTYKLGQTVEYESGLQVTLVRMKRMKIGQYAAGGGPKDEGVVVTVKITNRSNQTFDATLAGVDLSYGAEGNQAEQVYDSETVAADGFEGTIVKGRSKTASYEFAIPKGAKVPVVISISPDWDSEPTEFVSAI